MGMSRIIPWGGINSQGQLPSVGGGKEFQRAWATNEDSGYISGSRGDNQMTIYKTEGRGRLYNDIVETVGDTPCVRLNRTGPDHVSMFVKVESFNPLSSLTDDSGLNDSTFTIMYRCS